MSYWITALALASLTLGFDPHAQAGVVLSEVMANNVSRPLADGALSDWVELHNPTSQTADLAGASLSDTLSNPRQFVFAAGTTIPASGFLVIRFDSLSPVSATNTGFGLKASGDSVYLMAPPEAGGGVLDSVQFGLQAADLSIGRVPANSNAWMLTNPTPGSDNAAVTLGSASGLRVNEWMASPGLDWFEIYNGGAAPAALGGLYVTDSPGRPTRFQLPALSFVGVGSGGAYVKLIADSNVSAGGDHVGFNLNYQGEFIGIYSQGSGWIDQIVFGQQEWGVSEGRFPDGGTNIVRFYNTPTPAAPNRLLGVLTNVVINELLTHTDPPLEDAVELYNVTDTPVDISGWYLSDNERYPTGYRIPDGTVLQPHGYAVFYEYQFNPADPLNPGRFNFNSAHGGVVVLTSADVQSNLLALTVQPFGAAANGISFGRYATCDGRMAFVAQSARSFGIDWPGSLTHFRLGRGQPNAAPLTGPLIISEVMFRPPDISLDDNTLDEYIELRNITGQSLPLFDLRYPTNHWKLQEGVTFDFPSNTFVAPWGHLLLVNFDPVQNPVQLEAFRVKYGLAATVPVYGPYEGKLDNGEDTIELYKPDPVQLPPHPDAGFVPYVLVDRVSYRDSAPWPEGADGTGMALARWNPRHYSDEPCNWRVASPSPGASNAALPEITLQPQTQTYRAGVDFTFTVAAIGTEPLNYQWCLMGTNLPGATNPTLNILQADVGNVGTYTAVVSNEEGSVTSAPALLRVDPAKPTLTLAAPLPKTRVSNDTVVVHGTASDNFGVHQVLVRLNGSDPQPAAGTTNWSLTLQLTPGTNVLQAFAMDAGGNCSGTSQVSVVYVLLAALRVQTNGLCPAAVERTLSLELGRMYRLIASKYPGYLFRGWTGGVTNASPTLSFLMQSNLTLIAEYQDVQRPELRVLSPAPNTRLSNAVVQVRGTAQDRYGGVERVEYQLNGSAWEPATGTTNWETTITLVPGTNVFQTCAVDATGNRSVTNRQSWFHVVPAPLRVQTNGLCPAAAERMLTMELGRTYRLTASRYAGYLFRGWTGSVTNANPTLSFLMQSNLTLRAEYQDVQRPELSVLSPKPGARLSNVVFRVQGTARDRYGCVERVEYQLNGGAWEPATGTTNWETTVTLEPGTNVFQACAVDVAGTRSVTNRLSCFHVVPAPLLVQTNGLCPAVAERTLTMELGRGYRLTAGKYPGYLFRGWTGSVTNPNPTLSFLMQSNLTLTAEYQDVQRPELRLLSPAPNARVSNAVEQVRGTAQDRYGCVEQVEYRLNGSAWEPATGTTNWETTVMLVPGTNVFQACAVDPAGNRSATNSLRMVYAAESLSVPVSAGRLEIEYVLPAQSRSSNGLVRLRLSHLTASGSVVIEASSDLRTWTPIYTNAMPAGEYEFIDTTSTNRPCRFYRLRQQ